MEHEREASKRQVEQARLDALKHEHERAVDEDYESIDFTPIEGRLLIRFLEGFCLRDAKQYFANDVEALRMMKAVAKLSAGLREAGY